jgi:hypothetical protein
LAYIIYRERGKLVLIMIRKVTVFSSGHMHNSFTSLECVRSNGVLLREC